MVSINKMSCLEADGSRKVREVVIAGSDIIHVFEPTTSDRDKIIELQERFITLEEDDQEARIQVAGVDVIRELFPMLTDITGIEELSDEEISFIDDNPSTAFVQTSRCIETIISEVYKTVILSAKQSLLNIDLSIESERAQSEMVSKALSFGVRDGKSGGALDRLNEAAKDLEEMKTTEEKIAEEIQRLSAEEVQRAVEKEKDFPERTPVESVTNASVHLDRYKNAFSNNK